MIGHSNPDIDEDPALALRLSPLPPDAFNEQVVHLHSEASGWADRESRPTTPRDGEKDNVASASDAPQRMAPAFDSSGQVAEPQSSGSAPIDNRACHATPDEDDLELHLMLSQLPSDIFDEQVGELNRQGGAKTAEDDLLASLPAATPLLEVRTSSSVRPDC